MAKRSTPKISIVTPSLNQGKYLEATIRSVLEQNYPNLEYVIIDGGSKDGSLEIIKKYQEKLAYWISQPDKGQADAINKGFEKTTGEIMTWLNSDDILMPGSLNLVANIFSQLPDVDWISGIPTVINEDGLIVHRGYKPVFIREFIELGFYHGACLGFIMQEGTFWRRTLWEKVGEGLELKEYSSDFKLWRKFAREAQLVPVFTSLAAFRFNPRRKTRQMDKYYSEVGVSFPTLQRILLLPFRFFVHFILRFTRISPKIFYKHPVSKWYYHGSAFFRRPWFSRDKIPIANPRLY